MGGCQGNKVIEVNQIPQRNKSSRGTSKRGTNQLNIIEDTSQFPDMKEWSGERYSGIGIKRMKGYKCSLPIDKLNEKRTDFWRIVNHHTHPNYKIWRVINQACVYDEYRSNMILEEYHLTTAEGCINHIIDEEGNHYHIPNYCINDPYFEKELKVDDNVEERPLRLKLFEVSGNLNIEIETTNLATGKDLKKKFRKKAKIPLRQFSIRLFFAGNEIKNDQYLYQYKLDDDYKIQVMKIAKERRKSRKEGDEEKNLNKNNVNNNYNDETDG